LNHATDSFLNRRSARAPRGRRGYALATALVAVALPALAGCGGPFRPAPPKGILVILVDALRADQLQLYGSKVAIAPRLDALGPESVVFERAFSPASWTRPALPSLFTGLYPSEHGLTDFVGSAGQYKGAVLSESALTLAEEMKAAGRRTAMVGYQTLLSARFGMAQGFDFYNNNTNGGERIRKRFLEWFDEAHEQPFFAYLHYLDIHWPYCPPAPTWGKVDPTPNETITCDDWRGLRERIRSGETVLTEADRKALAARYSEEMMALDWELGALFDELKRRGAWDDLLIVVTADHGEELAERGGIEHGHTLYDELLHVPYIWKLPLAWGGGRGRRESGLVETRTLMPTLVDVVGEALPAGVSATSVLPWLGPRPKSEPPATWVVAESNGIYAVRTTTHKLVVTPAAKKVELYDLVADPGERHDLAPARPPELAELQGLMRRWRAGLRPIEAGATDLDDKTTEELKALGYL
jgi:arylsulfatase